MRDVRVDQYGELHCWKCLSTNFERKRTARSKLISGAGARASKKKLKCLVCGEYNDVGNAKKITERDTPVPTPHHRPSNAEPLDRLRQLPELRASGVPTNEEFAEHEAALLDRSDRRSARPATTRRTHGGSTGRVR